MAAPFSIRNLLQGELQDFVSGSGFRSLAMLGFVRDMTCLLAAYREEDVPLYPEVFALSSAEHISSISPGTQRVTIGTVALGAEAAPRVLKDCAPLAIDGWSIYVTPLPDAADSIEYGLFRSLRHAFATSAEESMLEKEGGDGLHALLIRNRGPLVVELNNAKDESLTVSFTSAPASESHFASHIGTFVAAATSDLPEDRAKRVGPYLKRLLIDVLQHCHGTLLAVFKRPDDGACPEQLKKGVWLQTPLPLEVAHADASTAKDAETLARLQSLEVLVRGMIESDGVVVFGTDGTVLAYRVFLSPTDAEKLAVDAEGGGRRRTFSLMKARLSGEFRAAFFRSQDGKTDCERNEA